MLPPGPLMAPSPGDGRPAREGSTLNADDAKDREPAAGPPRITAFERYGPVEPALFRAPPRRRWMDESAGRFAYRCLPLVMANQAGWLLRNPITFSASWNGGPSGGDIQILAAHGQRGFRRDQGPESVVESHFGEGVLTFQLPYLFQTSPGYNLWVKGPSNLLKDGIQALEGLVETDWSPRPLHHELEVHPILPDRHLLRG